MRFGFISEPIPGHLLLLQKDPPVWRLVLAMGSQLLMLAGLVAWPVAALRRQAGQHELTKCAHWTTGVAAALNVDFRVVFIACNYMEVVYEYPLIPRVAMIKASSEDSARDPILYLAGGL